MVRWRWRSKCDERQLDFVVQGQLHAIWKHTVTDREAAAIVRAQIPTLVLHGRHDILAMPHFGEKLARRYTDLVPSISACQI